MGHPYALPPRQRDAWATVSHRKLAKRLSGWSRFAPLACGLAVPLLIGMGILGGEQASILFFGFYTWAAFTLLGDAVRSGKQS